MGLSLFIEDIFVRDIARNTGIQYYFCISLKIDLPKTKYGGYQYLRDVTILCTVRFSRGMGRNRACVNIFKMLTGIL
jgi:hypothetical protein